VELVVAKEAMEELVDLADQALVVMVRSDLPVAPVAPVAQSLVEDWLVRTLELFQMHIHLEV
jgi:hypothetical protein